MDDDDRTILPPGRGPSPAPHDPDATRVHVPVPGAAPVAKPPLAPDGEFLPVGYVLQEFEVVGRLGQGGFSIAYRAWDRMLQREVALKEYMPSSMARRQPDCGVVVQSDRYQETFAAGLRSYIEEAKTLAGFDHPALVRVYRYFEANGTAYMVMQLALGTTLEKVSEGFSGPPDEPWLMELLDPLTAALQVVHAKGIAHRDIAPDNIMILEGSLRPLLLDFGAARRVIGENTKNPTAMLKPSYAPIEQYPETGLQQGAYTDVYALAAVVHRLMTGRAPPSSQSRSIRDSYEPLSRRLSGKYSARLLKGIDHALALQPQQRTPTIDAFRQEIGLVRAADGARGPDASPKARRNAPAWGLWAAGAGVLAGLLALVWWWTSAPTAMAPVPTRVEAAPTPSAPLAPAGVASQNAPQVPAAAVVPERIDPDSAFQAVVAAASPEFRVTLSVLEPKLKLGKTPLKLQLSSAVAGHYHLLVHDTDGALRVLYPSDPQEDNRIGAGQTLALPRPSRDPKTGFEITPDVIWEPAGSARLLAIVTESPIDLQAALKDPSGHDPVLWMNEDAGRVQRMQPQRPYLLGRLNCGAAAACPGRHGAAVAEFSVVP